MNKEEETANAGLVALAIPGMILLVLLIAVPFALFNAWVALTLYDWFVRPLGAPELTIWHMWGISLLVSRFLPTPEVKEGEGMGKAWGKLFGYLIAGLFALFVGFVIKGMI
jgi:hypothetical protein